MHVWQQWLPVQDPCDFEPAAKCFVIPLGLVGLLVAAMEHIYKHSSVLLQYIYTLTTKILKDVFFFYLLS